jgi:hypothetical protein
MTAYILDEYVVNDLNKFKLKVLISMITEMVFYEKKKIQKIRDKIEKLIRNKEVLENIQYSEFMDVEKLIDCFTTLFIKRYGMSCRECVERYAPDIKKQYFSTLKLKEKEDTFEYFFEDFFEGGQLLVECNDEGRPFKDCFNSLVDPASFLNIIDTDYFRAFQFHDILCKLGFEEGLYSNPYYEEKYYMANFDKYVYDYIHQ